ncbi:MAG: hypothetical protein ND866_30040, partial [Pyrinomonadaceae bacterium]|nr:hypothetical protein [Pyrinomonadaceae bacterium]
AIFHGDFAVVRYNPDGSLDQSFGVGGMVITDIDNVSQDEGRAVAIQNDGKIIVGGNATLTNSSSRFALVRYNTDGSLDMNFGTGGKVIESFGSYFSGLNGLVAQTDGKLVVAGESRSQLGKNDFALARFNTDGSLDASFGINGMVLTDIASDSYDIAYALALQADEKIVVAGSTSFAQNLPYGDFAVVRYNTDGSLDLSFGVSGRAITDFNGSTDQALAVTIQADGKLVVGGAAFTTGSTRQDFAIARYNSDGSLDASFGTGGKTTGNIFPSFSNHVVYAVAVEANGKIVFAGSAAVFSPVFAGQVPIFL